MDGRARELIDILLALLTIGILVVAVFMAPRSDALDNSSRVPVLLYHPQSIGHNCNADDTDVLALERDLAILREEGFSVIPASAAVGWYLGWQSGDSLPARAVVVTTDDGHDRNYLRTPNQIRACAGNLPSVRELAERYQAHITLFVIGSPAAREAIKAGVHSDNWWWEAQHHPLLDVQNHSIDHEHSQITHQISDPEIPAVLPAAGHADGQWHGRLDPLRWNNWASADLAFRAAAKYIERESGWPPQLVAHPMGVVSPYVEHIYFPSFPGRYPTYAAFCTELPERYMTLRSRRWCLPRMTHLVSWRTGEELRAILRGAE